VRRWLADDRALLTAVVLEGYLALTSTSNAGTAFALPWAPHLVVLCVVLLARISRPAVRRTLVVALLAVSAAALLVQSGLVPGARPVEVSLPGVGTLTVVDPRGVIQDEFIDTYPTLVADGGPLPAVTEQTRTFPARVAHAVFGLADRDHRRAYLLDAGRDPLLNTTRYYLEGLVHDRRILTIRSFDPSDAAPTVGSQAALMGRIAAPFLITGQPLGRPDPDFDRAREEAAARAAGYRVVRRFPTDDGRIFVLWEK
jgi:hypothetical protein